MISEKLSSIYTKAEDKYFDLLDFLDNKGLPVYAYSDFFEQKGIPSFVVTIAIFLLILILLSLFFASTTMGSTELVLNMKDASGNPLQSVKITLTDDKGVVIAGIKNLLKGDGDTIILPYLPQGTTIKLTAVKDGYQPVSEEFKIGESKKSMVLNFSKDFEGIDAAIILIDNETKTKITNARVMVNYDGQVLEFTADKNGIFKKAGVPSNASLILRVNADGYNDLEQTTVFTNSTPIQFLLNPSTASYVGKASLIVAVSDEEGNIIDDATVTIYGKETAATLFKGETKEGSIVESIQAGIALRIVVEKLGYLTFDTDALGIGYTIRKEQDKYDVILKQGGKKLVINARDSGLGLSVENAIIQIFNLEGVRLARAVTSIEGSEFSGLDPTQRVIITASHELYLPTRKEILVGATENEDLFLTKATEANSFRFDIYAIDKFGDSVNGARINLLLIQDGNILPYGTDELTANIGGYVYTLVERGKTYKVLAETETQIGETTIEVNDAIKDNKVYIHMEKKPSIIEMKFLDPRGSNIIGEARINGMDGTQIYDGNINNSRVFFNAELRETVEVNVILPDGNLFTENVIVKGKDYVEVIVYNKNSSDLTPSIEFVGLENENGETVQGITPNAFYWAKFNVVFPLAASDAGVHFRAGNDSINQVESDSFALFELSMQGAEPYYGTTYTPTPEPGNESVDRSNSGEMGEPNKWIEGSLSKPAGSYIVKVKIRASEFGSGKVPLKYRAWSYVGEAYYRTPEDTVLEDNSVSETKTGLYAETLVKELTIYESLPSCSDSLCVTTVFVDNAEKIFEVTNFEALQGNIYALEAEFVAQETDYLQVNVAGSSNLTFLGTQVGTFSFIKDDEYSADTNNPVSASGFSSRGTDTSSAITSQEARTNISLTKNGKQKVRFYFRGTNEGVGEIKFSATGTNSIEKDIAFKIVKEKELLVELSERNILLGRNFTVKVLDTGLMGVSNALIKIIDKEGKVVKSIVGDNTDGKGSSGNYRVQNDLGVGLYTIEVSAQGYATKSETLLITTQNVWTFSDTIEAKIPIGQKIIMINENLLNNSEFSISNITSEVSASEKFKITVIAPPILGKLQSQSVQLKIEYIGEEADTADETITLTLKGMVEGKFYTQLSSTIHAVYNKKLADSCLKIEPSSASIYLIGNAGATDSDTIEVTNNCEQAISLRHRIKEKTKRSYVIVTSEDIQLGEGETKNIQITANNLIERQYTRDTTYNYEITWDSNYLTKRVNVAVTLINPTVALSYPGQITLWLAQNAAGAKAFAAQPLYVTNVSQFPVEGISFAIDKEYATGGSVSITVEPPTAVNLEPRQAITPAKLVVAQSSSAISEPIRAKILINGKMGNLNNQQGNDRYDYYDNYYNQESSTSKPTTYYAPRNVSTGYNTTSNILGSVDVIVYYSGFNCLKAYPMDDLTYNLSIQGTQIMKRIKVQNTCAEPVIVTGATAPSKEIMFFVPTVSIPNDGTEVVMNLGVVAARQNLNLKNYPVTIHGITQVSQTPISAENLGVDIFSGDASTEYSKATKGVQVKECDSEEKVTIDTPKLASGKDCANGYCDAAEAVEYLSGKVKQAIDKAKSKAYSSQTNKQSFSCISRGYCSFGELGIKPESFDLYLQNDAITAEAFKEKINQTASGNTGFRGGISGDYDRVESVDVSQSFLEMMAGMGYARAIFIDRQFEGCGYYKVSINGAFNASGAQVQFEQPNVMVSIQNKVVTKECTDSIVNIANFTPIDEGFTLADNRGSWLTSVEGDSALKDLAKEIAKKQFEGEERAALGSGNRVILKQGALDKALAEMCLSPGDGKKIINVTVNTAIVTSIGTEKEKFTAEIAKLITKGLNADFEENCLVKSANGYGCVRLTELESSEMKLDVPNKNLMLNKTGESCVDSTITSNSPQTINIEIDPYEKEHSFTNINKIIIEDITNSPELTADRTRKYIYEAEFSRVNNEIRKVVTLDAAVMLEPNKDTTSKGPQFKKDLRICIVPGDFKQGTQTTTAYLGANGSMFIVRAINKSGGRNTGTEDADGTITVKTDSLHPDDLLALLLKSELKSTLSGKGENNPYYFTLNWAGSEEKVELSGYYETLRKSGKLNYAIGVAAAEGLGVTDEVSARQQEAKMKALWHYVGTCAGTSAICNGASAVFTLGGSLVSGVIFDCVLPSLFIFKKDISNNWETAEKFLKTIDGIIPDWIPGLNKIFEVNSGVPEEPLSWEKSVGAGAASGTFDALILKAYRMSDALNPGIVSFVGDETRKAMDKPAGKIVEKLFKDATTADAKATKEALVEFLTNKRIQALEDIYKSGIQKKGVERFVKDYSLKELKGTALENALKGSSDMVTPENIREFLTKTKIGTTGKTPLQLLAADPSKIDDLINAISGDLANAVGAKINPIDVGALQSKATSLIDAKGGSTIFDSTGAINVTMTDDLTKPIPGTYPTRFQQKRVFPSKAQLRSIVEQTTQEMADGLNLSATQKKELWEEVTAQLTSRGSTQGLTKTKLSAEIADRISNYTFTRPGNFTPPATSAPLKSVLKTNTDALVDEVATIAKKQVDNVADDITKALAKGTDSKIKRFWKAIWNKQTLKNLGSGIACGIISNYAGWTAYNYAEEKEVKKLYADTTQMPFFVFDRGERYQMILIDDSSNSVGFVPSFEKVEGDLEKQMNDALSVVKDKKINGTVLDWKPSYNKERPENRPLTQYLLHTDPEQLKKALEKNDLFTKEDITKYIARITNSQTQTLIDIYSGSKSARKIFDDESGIYAPESLVGTMTIVLWDDPKLDRSKEINGKSDYLKKKLELAISEIKNANTGGRLTEAVASKIFPTDSTKAKIFYAINVAWENKLNKSSIPVVVE